MQLINNFCCARLIVVLAVPVPVPVPVLVANTCVSVLSSFLLTTPPLPNRVDYCIFEIVLIVEDEGVEDIGDAVDGHCPCHLHPCYH